MKLVTVLLIAGLTFFAERSACALTLIPSPFPNGNWIAKTDGTLDLEITREDAATYCESLHQHLVSTREMAEFATALGARGIRETAFPEDSLSQAARLEDEQNKQDGYFPIRRLGKDQQVVVDFYYNSNGFNSDFEKSLMPTQAGAQNYKAIMTSQINPLDPAFQAYYFRYGMISVRDYGVYQGYAALCVK